jgi:hypothetical protein
LGRRTTAVISSFRPRRPSPVSGMVTRYYRGPPSDRFDGHRFFNPPPEHRSQSPPAAAVAVRRQAGDMARDDTGPPADAEAAHRRPADHNDGHATVLIQAAGRNLLMDPVWSERASPDNSLFPAILALWEQLLPVIVAIGDEAERASPLSETVISHPLASLAGALLTMQSNVEREAGAASRASPPRSSKR